MLADAFKSNTNANTNDISNANANANAYLVALFNYYAKQVPKDYYNRLWEQQNAGKPVFGEITNGQLPDWAIMIMTITFWKLFNDCSTGKS